MKRIAKLLTVAALSALLAPAAFAQGGTVVTSAVSRAFSLDTQEGTRESTNGIETLTFSTLWHPAGGSSVTILQSGAAAPVAAGLVGESNVVWSVDRDGTYVLTHSTMRDGTSIADETATFHVSGVTPPVEPTLRWKYAKNANGWYCAQVAFAWHTGYDTVVSDMRLLFADRTNAQGRLSAYLVNPATVIDPVAATETYDGVVYRMAPVDLSPFAELADGARAVFGVSDATATNAVSSVPAAERKICLRVTNRDLSSVPNVANMLACLAWKFDGRDVFLPIAETRSPLLYAASAPRLAASAPRPVTVAEANVSNAFGLAPAAVAGGTVTCRISSLSFGPDGSVEGTFSIAAEGAGSVVAESGRLAGEAKLTVLGAESLDGPFEPLGASAGAELLSREPPYAFRVADPGRNAFFKVQIECEDLYE